MTDERYRWRLLLISTVILLALGGLGARLAFLHLVENEKLRGQIEGQTSFERKIEGMRGRIFDRTGNYCLAMDLPAKKVCVNPQAIAKSGNTRFIGEHLARTLKLSQASVFSHLARTDKKYRVVKRFAPSDEAAHVERLGFDGVFFRESKIRNYPQHSLACHVIGFSNWEGIGSAGIEQVCQKRLQGRPGRRVGKSDGKGRELYDRREVEIPPKPGEDIYLTLDADIQYITEKAMEELMVEHQPAAAWAIVQRVKTGEILAMVSMPGYDLNDFRSSTPQQRLNRAIGFTYEPGSTFKVAVIAAALDAGAVTPDQMFDCEDGYWTYKGIPLRDYHGHGMLSVADILKESSNIGAAKIALELGEERLEKYLRAFGVGEATDVDLPGEEKGIFRNRSQWSGISVTRIAMGHEVAVTALQMLNVFNIIANQGFQLKPKVIQKIVRENGAIERPLIPEVQKRVIRPQTAALMCRLLRRVTEEGGTGTRAALDEYAVAGKTGTAQKPEAGGYSQSNHMASFAGFLPAQDPEISIIVVADSPQPRHTGGAVAAPAFKKIAEQVLRRLQAQPESLTSL